MIRLRHRTAVAAAGSTGPAGIVGARDCVGEGSRAMIELDEIALPGHIEGYPEIAFGGYVAGVLAERAESAFGTSTEQAIRVDFRRPIPAGSTLRAQATDGGVGLFGPDDLLMIESRPAALSLVAQTPTTWPQALAHAEATAAARTVTACYGCGSACAPGRGLRLAPEVLGERVVAAWTPDRELAGPDGSLSTADVWAALDCPGGWAAMRLLGMRRGAFTAALTTRRIAPVRAGVAHISHAWPLARDGRKYTVGVALTTADGSLCALAEALWIEPRPTP